MCEYCEKGKKIEEVENDNIYFTVFGRFLRVHGRPMCRKEAGRVIHITLKEMLEEIVQCILEQKEIKDYYWKDGEGEFRRITEIDLLDRIRTSNDDFTEFEWELEESRLYKVQYGRRSLMTNEEFEEIFGNVPFENIEKIQKYIKENYISKEEIEKYLKEEQERFEVYKRESKVNETLKLGMWRHLGAKNMCEKILDIEKNIATLDCEVQ